MSAVSTPSTHPTLLRRIIQCVFILALLVNLWALTRRWNASLRDGHEFRQYQTALTAYYFQKDGLRLDYETPVLGPPWSIPFEFPAYQAVVAKLSTVSGVPLEQAGRLASILFFYATLPAVWLLLRHRLTDSSERLLALTPALLCPVLLFYSRTFMIESTALCLTAWFAVCFEMILSRVRVGSLLAVWLFGALAALTKITTFAAFWIFLAALVVERVLVHRRTGLRWIHATGRVAGATLLGFSVPFLTEFAWLRYSDRLKEMNPYAKALTSYAPGLRSFSMGTLTQRITFDWWKEMAHITANLVLAWPGLIVLLVGFFLVAPIYRRMALICAVSYAGGFLLFSNLYFIHDYYFYASVLFILIAFGIVSAGLLRSRFIPWGIALLLIVGGLAGEVHAFSRTYYSFYRRQNDPIPFEAEIVRRLTAPDDVFAGFGYDWNSMLPYCAQRRGIMPFISHVKNFEELDQSLAGLGKRHLTTVVVTSYFRTEYPFIGILKSRLQLTPQPVVSTADADVYVRKDQAASATKILASRSDWNGAKLNPQPDAGALMVLHRYDLRTPNWQGKFPMASPTPMFSMGPVEIGILMLEGNRPVISTQAPTEIYFQPPAGSRSIEAIGGMVPGSYTEGHTTPGVVLAVYEESPDGSRHVIFERTLAPLTKPGDRGDVVISYHQEKPFAGTLVFAHHAIPSGDVSYSWSYWKQISIR